jgi:hypothetical protein
LQGNLLPATKHAIKQIMKVQDISKLEWHSCETGCTGWRPQPQAHWHKHKDDACTKCGGKRFKTVLGRLVPVRVSGVVVLVPMRAKYGIGIGAH